MHVSQELQLRSNLLIEKKYLLIFSIASIFLCLGFLALGVWTLIRTCIFIATTGGNSLSNDYRAVVTILDSICSGHYNWTNFFKDTFARTHWMPLPILVHLFDAVFFQWNMYTELFIGVTLAAAKTFFLTDAIAHKFGWKNKIALLGMFLALTFCSSQLSVFLFGQASIPIGLSLLGFTIALWGLTRFPNSHTSLAVMLLGGTISSTSWGNTLPAWGALLIALVLLHHRKFYQYLLWLIGTALSLLPYAYFLIFRERMEVSQSTCTPFNFIGMLDLLGLPFSNNIGYCTTITSASIITGLIGLVMLTIVIAVHKQKKSLFDSHFIAGIALCSYGLISAWLISTFRESYMAWYATITMIFWAGLIAIYWSFLAKLFDQNKVGINISSGKTIKQLLPIIGVIGLSVVGALFIRTNGSVADKDCFMYSRTPISESTLRNYLTAPTYTENSLFQWGDGNPGYVASLSEPLARHRWSAFADKQQWSLQGDFPMHNVAIHQQDDVSEIMWLQNTSVDSRAPWYHYRWLNLYLHSPNSIEWTLSLPENLHNACLHTAVMLAKPFKNKPFSYKDGAIAKVALLKGETTVAIYKTQCTNKLSWNPIDIPLDQFRGQDIKLKFACNGIGYSDDDQIVFKFPKINLELEHSSNPTPPQPQPLKPCPSNTDLSPYFPKTTDNDYVLNDILFTNWAPTTLEQLDKPNLIEKSVQSKQFTPDKSAIIQKTMAQRANREDMVHPTIDARGASESISYNALVYKRPINLLCKDYSHIQVEMSAPSTFIPRTLKLYLQIDNKRIVKARIPLLPDSKSHRYTYDLKLLELPNSAKLTHLGLSPVLLPDIEFNTIEAIHLSSIRLIHK